MSGVTKGKREFLLYVKNVIVRRKHTNPAQQEAKQLTIPHQNLTDKYLEAWRVWQLSWKHFSASTVKWIVEHLAVKHIQFYNKVQFFHLWHTDSLPVHRAAKQRLSQTINVTDQMKLLLLNKFEP